MKTRWKITLGIIAGLAVVITIICMSPLGRFILSGGLGELEEQPFNSEQWKSVKSGDVVELRVRMLMLDDLINNNLKTGMDSVAVKELLGEPDRVFGFSYSVGSITHGMKPGYLVIDYDKSGKLAGTHMTGKNAVNVKVE